jgi:hypothetical protein
MSSYIAFRRLLLCLVLASAGLAPLSATTFKITFPHTVRNLPVTGRLLLIVSPSNAKEPRFQIGDWENKLVPIFGVDVEHMSPDTPTTLDASAAGFPMSSLERLPTGEYYVQAVLNVYTQCHRSDGHTVWVHLDQWEGQQFNNSPGNLVSEVRKVRLNAQSGYQVHLTLDRVIPPVHVPADTEWVRRIKFQSGSLSRFWGCPIFLGATLLLPKGYATHPNLRYPAVYLQGHFSLEAPFGFDALAQPAPPRSDSSRQRLNVIEPRRPLELVNEALVRNETAYEFFKAWTSSIFPRMIAVTLQHPTPYYDDSYAVNSENAGPYGDAIIHELIPRIEAEFRTISKPYARVLTGGSTGGWESLALQVQHPSFFGGTWSFYPDPVDFRRWGLVDIYQDQNYYQAPGQWKPLERYFFRSAEGQPQLTNREMTRLESVLGSRLRSGEQFAAWQAIYGPVGEDGYPKRLYDVASGQIDRKVAVYMRKHGYDLRYFLETHWSQIGPELVGKLHIICGDMDNFYLNLAVYKLQDFLANTTSPYYAGSFQYGRPMKGHGWQPTTNIELILEIARHISESAAFRDVALDATAPDDVTWNAQ